MDKSYIYIVTSVKSEPDNAPSDKGFSRGSFDGQP